MPLARLLSTNLLLLSSTLQLSACPSVEASTHPENHLALYLIQRDPALRATKKIRADARVLSCKVFTWYLPTCHL